MKGSIFDNLDLSDFPRVFEKLKKKALSSKKVVDLGRVNGKMTKYAICPFCDEKSLWTETKQQIDVVECFSCKQTYFVR